MMRPHNVLLFCYGLNCKQYYVFYIFTQILDLFVSVSVMDVQHFTWDYDVLLEISSFTDIYYPPFYDLFVVI